MSVLCVWLCVYLCVDQYVMSTLPWTIRQFEIRWCCQSLAADAITMMLLATMSLILCHTRPTTVLKTDILFPFLSGLQSP